MHFLFICHGDVAYQAQIAEKRENTKFYSREAKTQKRGKRIMTEQKVKQRFPMNLQFFAEGGDPEPGGSVGDPEPSGNEPTTPTLEELMSQLAESRAENAKQKAALDKALKEKGDLTKMLRSKQSAEEVAEEERRLADEKRQQEYENAISELNRIKAQKAYSKSFSDEKTIDTLIEAVNDKDHNSIAMIFDKAIKNAVETAVKEKKAEWMKSRPQPRAGIGNGEMTKEQILAIKDPDEQRRAIAMNLDVFK